MDTGAFNADLGGNIAKTKAIITAFLDKGLRGF